MDKQKLIWMLAAGAIVLAAGICAYQSVPKEPVVMTYQAAGVTAESVTEAICVQTQTSTQTKPAQTTAVRTSVTEAAAAETEIPAPQVRDLNLAAEADLQRVSGIGPALAGEIVAYRTALGGFTYRGQLLEISGIGETLLARIMEEFEIPNEQPPPADIPLPDEPVPPDIQPEMPPETEPPSVPHYNANTVTREELLTLPEMTEARADAILTMRERLGEYHGIYEIMLADGISGEYFERVLHVYLYVEGDPYSDVPEAGET